MQARATLVRDRVRDRRIHRISVSLLCLTLLWLPGSRAWSQCRVEDPPPLGELWGSLGSVPGLFNQPRGLAIDSDGRIFVGDTQNYRIQVFSREGLPLDAWGEPGPDPGDIGSIVDLEIDAAGRLFVMSYPFIKIFTTDGTYLETWFGPDSAQGDTLLDGGGMDVDDNGCLYVTDCGHNRVFKLDPDGSYSISPWGSSGSGDGQFSCPTDIAVDRNGCLYVVDAGNARIQKFENDGTYIAQWGSAGTGPGEFLQPVSIDIDARGNIYVADVAAHRIQKFNADGICLGTWGQYGSLATRFNQPNTILVDSCSVFVAERLNHRVQRFDYPPAAFTAIHDPGTGDKLVVRWRVCAPTNPASTQAILSDQPGGEPLEYGQASPVLQVGANNEFVHVFDGLAPYTHYYVSFRLAYGTPAQWSEPYTPEPDDWWWATYPVFLVHGILSNSGIWMPMEDALYEARASYVRSVDLEPTGYPGEVEFNGNAFILSNFIEQETEAIEATNLAVAGHEIPLEKIDIIGHSMGGLVARRYIAGQDYWAMLASGKRVARLFTLGTPHTGVESGARFCENSTPEFRHSVPAPCEMVPNPMIRFNGNNANLNGAALYTAMGTAGRSDNDCADANPSAPAFLRAMTVHEKCPNDGVVWESSARGEFLAPVQAQPFPVWHTDLHSNNDVISWVQSLLLVPPTSTGVNGNEQNRPNYEVARLPDDGGTPAQVTSDDCAALASGGEFAATSVLTESGQLSLLVTAEGAGIVLRATSPSGTTWRSDALPPDSPVSYEQSGHQCALFVPDAEAGSWIVGVERSPSASGGIACLRTAVLDGLVAHAAVSDSILAMGAPLAFFCTLTDHGGAILGADVSAAVLDSAGTTVAAVAVADDGATPDVTADDGIYSGQWAGPAFPGIFNIGTTANGTSHSGFPFVRILNTPVAYFGTATAVRPPPDSSIRRVIAASPNPTAAGTLIQWSGVVGSWCRISVLDLRGGVVWSEQRAGATGAGQVEWRGRAMSGQRIASGIYIVRVEDSAGVVGQGRVVLLR